MSNTHKISLPAAIFININIMLGTGTFINTVLLSRYAGQWGGLLYLAAGIVVLPLILSIAFLSRQYNEGNFYNFGSYLHPFFGFISSWSYFVAKLATATLSVHVFTMFLKHIFPQIPVSFITLDTGIIVLFVLLNTLHVKTGSKIQYAFVLMKTLPLLFAITVGLLHFNNITIDAPAIIWSNLSIGLPLVLFCCLGFEASCSLSKVIKDPQKNTARAIIISFSLVLLLSALYQYLFYNTLGNTLAEQNSYIDAFPLLIQKACGTVITFLDSLFSLAIATSALGSAYGILYSNYWNLHILAEKKLMLFSNQLTKVNQHHIPVWCVVIEGLICLIYLFSSKGKQIPLQYTATLGCIASYTISVVSYYFKTKSLLSFLGLISCCLLLAVCVNGFIATSIIPLFIFGSILIIGALIFYTHFNESLRSSEPTKIK